jgi:hypothetical protein
VREVSDRFLLNMAEVSGTLIGLFLVGVFFYVETGSGTWILRSARSSAATSGRARASSYSSSRCPSVSRSRSSSWAGLEPGVFLLLSVMLVAANVETVRRLKALGRVTGLTIFQVNEVVGSAAVVVLVVLPWALGGFHPSREDLTWAILHSFGTGFLSISALVLSIFAAAADERGA